MSLDTIKEHIKQKAFTLGRKFIENGSVPSKRAIRLIKKWNKPLYEEMINRYHFRRSAQQTKFIFDNIHKGTPTSDISNIQS